eukprot:NODE_98_length_21025_cov_0.475055.p17 type:complete len:100 gc:universal NODE_98_length_21025_cov_0.475055:18563-18264(-)
MILRATQRASCKFLSNSLIMSFAGPRNMMVHAFRFMHSSMKVKYSSPIWVTLKSLQFNPTSDSTNSSGLLTMRAPQTRCNLKLSDFLTLRIAVMLCCNK